MPATTPPSEARLVAMATRPKGVTVVSVVAMVLGSMMLVGAGLLIVAGTLQGPWGNFHEFGELAFWLPTGALAAGLALAVIGAAHLAVGIMLIRRSLWARRLALLLIALQLVSGLAAVARGEYGQLSQAVAYALAGAALLTPRARAWFGSPL